MTESEALKLLKKANRDNDMVGILPKSDIGKCLIKALEKQIPKKPVERIGTISIVRKSNGDASYRVYYDCPTCGEEYMERDKPCWNCRQNLDWSKYKKVEWIRSGEV